MNNLQGNAGSQGFNMQVWRQLALNNHKNLTEQINQDSSFYNYLSVLYSKSSCALQSYDPRSFCRPEPPA